MYKNLKIRTKMLIGYTSITLISFCSMIFALTCLNSVGGLAHQMFSGPLVSTTESMGIKNDLNLVGKDLRSAALEKNYEKYASEIKACSESIQLRLDQIEEAFGGDKQMVTDLRNAIGALVTERENVIAKFEEDDFQGATDIILTSYVQAFSKASEAADKLYVDAGQRASSFDTSASNTSTYSLIVSVILLSINVVLAVFMTWISTRAVTRPLQEVTDTAKKMAEGSLKVDVSYHSKDELGSLADSFRIIIGGISNIVEDVDYLLGEMADGNFSVATKAEDRYIGDYHPILLSMQNINTKLSDTLQQINESSSQVSSGSEQVSSGAQALSQGTTEQASSIEELAATLGDISNQITQTASNSERARELTNEARREVDASNEQMQELIVAMQKISQSSNEIGKIIKAIEDIAFQTNILALNAAVEAARAGEAGKGFAVVADEVRNLASKSAEASKNTAALIENSIHSVDEGTRIADSAASSLRLVVEGTQSVVGIVEQISAAAKEQSESVGQITQGIDQISSVVQTNSATAEESAAASEELSGQAEMLRALVSRFKLKNGSTGSVNPVQTKSQPEQNHYTGSFGGKY